LQFKIQTMISKNIIYLLLLLSSFSSFSQEKFTISGNIFDANSNESLIGVNIIAKGTKSYAITNEYGFYSLTLPKGEYEIVISSVGFSTLSEKIVLTQNTKKNYSLAETGQELDEVIINTEKTTVNIRKPEMSVNKLSISTIKKMPVVLGEVDVIKSILFFLVF